MRASTAARLPNTRFSGSAPARAGREQRVVIVEFASFEQAKRVYASEAYQAALQVLGTAAERDFRIVEGVA
jgi:uncharacterized protein (DUF1330 family)